MAEKRTELSDLGEFGIIERIKNSVKLNNESTLEGIGDDAAIIEPKDKQVLMEVQVNKKDIPIAKKALIRAKSKLPMHCIIEVLENTTPAK